MVVSGQQQPPFASGGLHDRGTPVPSHARQPANSLTAADGVAPVDPLPFDMWVRYDLGPSVIVPLDGMTETPVNALAIPQGEEVLFVHPHPPSMRSERDNTVLHPTPEELFDSDVGTDVGSPVVKVREAPSASELPTVAPISTGSEMLATLQTLRTSVDGYAATVAQIVQQTDEIRRVQARSIGEAEELVGEAEARLSTAMSENRKAIDRQIGVLSDRLSGAEARIKEVARKAADGQKNRLAAIEERLSNVEATFDYMQTVIELLNWKARAAEYALNQATRQLKIALGAEALRDVKSAAAEASKSLAPSKRAALDRVKWYAGRALKLTRELPSS